MDVATVLKNLERLLQFEELEGIARATGALERERKLHPVHLLRGYLATTDDGTSGRMAAVLRYVETEYEVTVDRSSFYKRMNAPFSRFVHEVAERVLRAHLEREYPALGGKLAAFRDILAWDSTTIRLRAALARAFSASAKGQVAGVKVHGAVSLRNGALVDRRITPERVHDSKGFCLSGSVEDVLVILDRAYSGHKPLKDLHEGQGWFLMRLKLSTNPHVTGCASHRSLAPTDGTLRLDEWLQVPLEPGPSAAVDLDVELSLKKNERLKARVVGVPRQADGGEVEYWWYVTNLPREEYDPEMVALLYRLRWQVELLWKSLKSQFQLQRIEALTEHNVHMLIDLALLAYLLSLGVLEATTTRTERKRLSPGLMALAFPYLLPRLVELVDARDRQTRLNLAARLRRNVLSLAKDPNWKRRAKSARAAVERDKPPQFRQMQA